MPASSSLQSQPFGVWKSLRSNTISVTLKFGFDQISKQYSVTDANFSIIDHLYHDAEQWLRSLYSSSKNVQMVGRCTIYLYRISLTDFSMIPIVQSSDLEQNSFIEIVLVPVEINEQPHSLHRCQLNIPTNCSRCTRFIAGLYKQGFRCQNCRMTFHKDCAPFLLNDCKALTNSDRPRSGRSSLSSLKELLFDIPFSNDSGQTTDRITTNQSAEVQVYSTSLSTPRESAQDIAPNMIIDKGIFPACIRGAHFCRRYLFRLTINTLSMSMNLSRENVALETLPPSSDTDTTISLTDIEDLVLTDRLEDRDDIFEIHLREKAVISVGKKTDSDELKMTTCMFYSAVREYRETLINTMPSSSPLPRPLNASPTPPTTATGRSTPNSKQNSPRLKYKPSLYQGMAGEDLHEQYAFTGETIGEGAFGRVLGAYQKSSKQQVAVKIMEKNNCGSREIQRINEEISHLCKFNHINILKLEAYYERHDAVYLVTERVETDLCKYINASPNGYLDEEICRMLTFQVILALKYLHEKDCGHLDVKCENILLTRLKPKPSVPNQVRKGGVNYDHDFPLIKLADFGYSRIIGENSFRKTRVGTKVYNAPEIYYDRVGYNRLADMWSAGIVLYAALSGTLPYDEQGYARVREIVRDESSLFGNRRWASVSKSAKDLLLKNLLVIQVDSRARPSDVLFHDWFTDIQLYRNLREIERRTGYLMSTKNEELTPALHWLTAARADPVWVAYATEPV